MNNTETENQQIFIQILNDNGNDFLIQNNKNDIHNSEINSNESLNLLGEKQKSIELKISEMDESAKKSAIDLNNKKNKDKEKSLKRNNNFSFIYERVKYLFYLYRNLSNHLNFFWRKSRN